MTQPRKRRALALLPFAAATLLALVVMAAGFAGVARAADSMQGMDMSTPMPTATAATSGTTSGSGDMSNMSAEDMAKMPNADGSAMDPNMDMSSGSVNWLVIGGVIVLIVGATGAAVVTKRRLRRRAASGELADAGVQDV